MHHHKMRERWMRGPRRGEGWGHEHGWHGRHRHAGGMRRMFDQGDLRIVVMALLAQQPRHGYDLIKEIETMSGGLYAPSPGVIYPLLTLLEEMGLARLDSSEGSKKLYALTEEGQADLAGKRENAEQLLARLAAVKERMSGGRAPQIVRAMENLRMALKLRAERGINEGQAQKIASALDAAAQAIERA